MSPFRRKATELYVSRHGAATLTDAPRAGATLDILVSDALTRYWILDCPPGLASAHELDLLAADRFATLFGADPADWVIRVDPVPQAGRWLACALPRPVAEDLPGQAAARGWQPRSVVPRFVREYNRHCRRLDRTAAFCVAAEDSTTLGLIEEGEWRGIRVHPPLDRSQAGFSALLYRDCRQAGLRHDRQQALRPLVVGALRALAFPEALTP